MIDLCRQRRTNTNAGAKLLVGGFKTSRDIDGVTIGGVVEEPATAEIANNRGASVNTNPRDSEGNALLLAASAE